MSTRNLRSVSRPLHLQTLEPLLRTNRKTNSTTAGWILRNHSSLVRCIPELWITTARWFLPWRIVLRTADSSIRSTMEQLISLCNDSMLYPQNFTQRTNHEYKLGAYYLRINEHSHRLFTPEEEASLDFWDFDIDGKSTLTNIKGISLPLVIAPKLISLIAFWPTNVSSMDRLKIHLNITPYTKKQDPRSRFLCVFLLSPYSFFETKY